MKKPRIFMTAEEKYEESKKNIQELTEEIPSIVNKLENTCVSLEESYEKMYQSAKDSARLGQINMSEKMLMIAVQMQRDK